MIHFQNRTGKNEFSEDFATRSLQELQQVVRAFVPIDFHLCSKIERKLTGETETVGNSSVLKEAGIVLFK